MFVPAHKPNAHGDGTRQEPALAAGRDEQKATVVDRLPYLRTLANFYVAVKSCPLIILAGPAGSGKLTLTRLVTLSFRLFCVTVAPRFSARSI